MEIGAFNNLEIIGKTARGLILTDGQTKILLPKKEIPRDLDLPEELGSLPDPEKKQAKPPVEKKSGKPAAGTIKGRLVVKTAAPKKKGPEIKVFVYNSDRETVRATTKQPLAVRGEFAYLKVKEVNSFGAFLEWGIPKDLFLPFGAQGKRVKEGEWVMVFVAMDSRKTGIIGFSNLEHFLLHDFKNLKEGQKVKVIIRDFTKNGARVVVEDRYPGLIYQQDFDGPLKEGQIREGWIRTIRNDGKIDIGLWEKNIDVADKFKAVILEKLQKNDGFLPITDKTSPEIIREKFGMSKRMYKMSVGVLMKEGKLEVHPTGLYQEGTRAPKTHKVKAKDLNDLVMPGYDQNAEEPEEKKGRHKKDR